MSHSTSHDLANFNEGMLLPGSAAVFDEEILAAARRLGVLHQLEPAYQLTKRLFTHIKSLKLVPDPEIPDTDRLVFTVAASPSVDDTVDREGEWCRQLFTLPFPAPEVFCLSIDVPA